MQTAEWLIPVRCVSQTPQNSKYSVHMRRIRITIRIRIIAFRELNDKVITVSNTHNYTQVYLIFT